MSFNDMREVRAANAAIGNHWFEPSTLRFFRSRVGRRLYTGAGGQFFISSEQFDENHPRLYSVRQVMPDGSIETVGDFQAHPTRSHAEAAILWMCSR